MTPEQWTALITAIVGFIGALSALLVAIRHIINHDTPADQGGSPQDQPPAGGGTPGR